jgi:cobalt-zinc-cadmium efflux system membrane fusion protein
MTSNPRRLAMTNKNQEGAPMLRVLKFVFGTCIAVALIGAFALFVLDIPLFGKAKAETEPPKPTRQLATIELVPGKPHTVAIPESVRRSLGIRRNGQDVLAKAEVPRQMRPLVLPGSTALDPARIMRIRARFAPAEVVSIKLVDEPQKYPPTTPRQHELRPGDEVKAGQELATFFSPDVGNKKNDLFEAIVQLRLDQVILDKAEKAGGSLPEIYLWNARRNVDTDRSAVRRAKNTLKTWNIADEDIQAVEKEALQLSVVEGRRQEIKEAEWAEKHNQWARVVLRTPDDGVVIERNVSKGETVVDNTINLFTLAKVDQLAVVANCPEDDLPEFYRLPEDQKKWTVQTVGASSARGVEGTIDEVGWLIDPNQHTAVIKGYIPNSGGKIRAGQFVSATVQLLPPEGVVEIPTEAVVEDGKQSVVFVQTDAAAQHYNLRRVEVVSRHEKTVLVRAREFEPEERLTEEERKENLLPREPLSENDKVLTSGVLELKAALTELEARRGKGN